MKGDIAAQNHFPLFSCLMNCDFEMKSKSVQLKQIQPNSDKTLLRVVLSVSNGHTGCIRETSSALMSVSRSWMS